MGIKIHIKAWNIWRKHNTNGKIYKLFVLLKLTDSPTMPQVYFMLGMREAFKDKGKSMIEQMIEQTENKENNK